ncbi:MAG: biotin/lipoyl-containing protein [Dehalococcoidia bacterium]|jgi:acetyl-CoA/propionyl-CoA carboxylase biotin carboxyl carrier protein|nr:biotin/lipoyl-containing protein [Dehalococcoidia bacterium]
MGEKFLVYLGDDVQEVEVTRSERLWQVTLGGRCHNVRVEQVGPPSLYLMEVDGRPIEAFVEERAGGFEITIGFHRYAISVRPARGFRPPAPRTAGAWQGAEADQWLVLSPIGGIVVEIKVDKGSVVHEGDVLLVIESMKMNNELRAKRGGMVQEIYVREGQRVEAGQALLRLS